MARSSGPSGLGADASRPHTPQGFRGGFEDDASQDGRGARPDARRSPLRWWRRWQRQGSRRPPERAGAARRTSSGAHVVKAAAKGFDARARRVRRSRQEGRLGASRRARRWRISSSPRPRSKRARPARSCPEALYNAGLAYQRCDKDAEARAQFEAAVKVDSQFHRARAQLALYDFEKDEGRRRHDREARPDHPRREVPERRGPGQPRRPADGARQRHVGSGRQERHGARQARTCSARSPSTTLTCRRSTSSPSTTSSKPRRRRGKRRARTRKRRGLVASSAKAKDVNSQQLDLAALVASQGIRKNPNYAPLHNTSGLIQVELRNFNGAVKSFATARELDPKFFEAHMNYARGEPRRSAASRRRRRPIATRSSSSPRSTRRISGWRSPFAAQIKPGELRQARGRRPRASSTRPRRSTATAPRPTTTRRSSRRSTRPRAARRRRPSRRSRRRPQIYRQFIDKAGSDAGFADAVKRAKERTQDIEDTIKFIEEGEAAEGRSGQEGRRRGAPQPAAGQAPPEAGDDGAPAPPPPAEKKP